MKGSEFWSQSTSTSILHEKRKSQLLAVDEHGLEHVPCGYKRKSFQHTIAWNAYWKSALYHFWFPLCITFSILCNTFYLLLAQLNCAERKAAINWKPKNTHQPAVDGTISRDVMQIMTNSSKSEFILFYLRYYTFTRVENLIFKCWFRKILVDSFLLNTSILPYRFLVFLKHSSRLPQLMSVFPKVCCRAKRLVAHNKYKALHQKGQL